MSDGIYRWAEQYKPLAYRLARWRWRMMNRIRRLLGKSPRYRMRVLRSPVMMSGELYERDPAWAREFMAGWDAGIHEENMRTRLNW